jgi:hypothetical protein
MESIDDYLIITTIASESGIRLANYLVALVGFVLNLCPNKTDGWLLPDKF